MVSGPDSFHPIADPDPLWTETTWWGLVIPEQRMGGMVYTLFRPNLGVASVVVAVWDSEAAEPWRAPYARSQWHVPHPDGDLTDCRVGGLSLQCLEPLTAYRLAYEDGDSLRFDLAYTALAPPHDIPAGGGNGHFDQVCRVAGELHLGDTTIAVDAPAVRDRSWYVRQDVRTLRAGYTYAVVSAEEHVVLHSFAAPDAGDETAILSGYLQRDGRRTAITGGTRAVRSRRRGHPDRIEIEATDADGRKVVLTGETYASLASQSTPGMFAWMSSVAWTLDGATAAGEDHDVWSPDLLAAARRG